MYMDLKDKHSSTWLKISGNLAKHQVFAVKKSINKF